MWTVRLDYVTFTIEIENEAEDFFLTQKFTSLESAVHFVHCLTRGCWSIVTQRGTNQG